MRNSTQRKRLGYITEEQETAELLQQTNGGGGSYTDYENVEDPVRYVTDPIYVPPAEIATETVTNSGPVVQDQPATIDPTATTLPTTEPTKTINWKLLIAVAIGFYLITKKS